MTGAPLAAASGRRPVEEIAQDALRSRLHPRGRAPRRSRGGSAAWVQAPPSSRISPI